MPPIDTSVSQPLANASAKLRVSRSIRDEFDNGRDYYYALEGRRIRMPAAPNPPPVSESLEWHADTMYRG